MRQANRPRAPVWFPGGRNPSGVNRADHSKPNLIAQRSDQEYVLLSYWIEGFRAIRHSHGTETRLTGTGRQSRARPSSRKAPPAGRQDLAGRLRPLQAEMRRRLTRADVLTEMIRAVNASLEPERVADAIVARVSAWIPVPGWLVLASTEDGEIRPWHPAAFRRRSRRRPRTSASSWRVRRRHSIRRTSRPTAAVPKAEPRHPPAAAIGFPLECRGRTVGALIGIDRAPSAREPKLAAATLSALRQALEPGAFALDNAMRMQRAEALSVTDDLTQLYNSRYLSQVLRRETKRASRSGRPLSLLFIDLDGFKSINDTHGHLSGSRGARRGGGGHPQQRARNRRRRALRRRRVRAGPARYRRARAPRRSASASATAIAAHRFLQERRPGHPV